MPRDLGTLIGVIDARRIDGIITRWESALIAQPLLYLSRCRIRRLFGHR